MKYLMIIGIGLLMVGCGSGGNRPQKSIQELAVDTCVDKIKSMQRYGIRETGFFDIFYKDCMERLTK